LKKSKTPQVEKKASLPLSQKSEVKYSKPVSNDEILVFEEKMSKKSRKLNSIEERNLYDIQKKYTGEKNTQL